TGLKYLPGVFAEVEEIIELATAAARYGGIYTSHLREEGIGLIEGVGEAIRIGHQANIPVVLTHHKVVGEPMWGASQRTLAMVDSARALGVDVMLDHYPYTASCTDLSILIPSWCLAGGQEEFVNRTQNPVLRDSILRGIKWNLLHDRGGGDLDRVQLASTPWDSSLAGKTLKYWAHREGLEPTVDHGARLILEAQLQGGGKGIYHAMDEDDLRRIMRHPLTMIGSDGFLTSPDEAWAHPRSYGTYPRILGHYVREEKVIDLPTAIQKMTSMPADRLGLNKRGRLQVGNYADIVIFDPAAVKAQATFMDPHQYSSGIEYVLVNGTITIEGGEFTKERAGRVLRKTELN
ncbi:MAG TPA: amidohydrolase family protein, partial [Membranihabitans sp.]|nr:amidohydrolase family protein [Membranihabitans sp.]